MTALARTTFELPGGTFHALVGGAPRAPALVFLHGFPDHPPTAAPMLGHLARTHRVIAPWLRGYAPSPRAGPYDLGTLAADVVALIDAACGPAARVDLVGHDWGAAITYLVCDRHAARVRRAVTLALPHPLRLFAAMRGGAQRRASAYMALFQLPGAGALARARDLALIDALWRRWSPGLTLPAGERAALHACLAASLPAPLGYYRAIPRPASLRLLRAASRTRITVPSLHLHGADDGCVLPLATDDAHLFAERAHALVPGVGHFLHVEDPAGIAARIAAYLA